MRIPVRFFPVIAVLIFSGIAAADATAQELLIPPASKWQYHAQVTPPPKEWKTKEFDASSWKTGEAGFGGANCIGSGHAIFRL